MYARLLAPLMFGDCVWLDADQVVLRDMQELLDMRFAEPLAAVQCDRNNIARCVIGMENPPEGDSIYSGLMVFNAEEYRRQRVTERCLQLMDEAPASGIVYRFVVQSVLSVVLEGNFHRLDPRWQGFANRSTVRAEEWFVLHWHGRKRKPWNTPDMANVSTWRNYFCMS
jgi:lipopolysaccharide biosynthesis glycosyltransferase